MVILSLLPAHLQSLQEHSQHSCRLTSCPGSAFSPSSGTNGSGLLPAPAASPKATSRVLLVVLQPHQAAGATQPWARLALGLLPQGGGRGWVPYPTLIP